jgi:hypothetical protein
LQRLLVVAEAELQILVALLVLEEVVVQVVAAVAGQLGLLLVVLELLVKVIMAAMDR